MNNNMTVEEKARESADKYCLNDEQHKAVFSSGYRVGYNEAMRWRDPSELPLGYESDFLIKYESGEIRRFEEDALFDIITHWRPIE